DRRGRNLDELWPDRGANLRIVAKGVPSKQLLQSLVDSRFARARRQMKDPYILDICPTSRLRTQRVVGLPERECRKERFPVLIAGKGSRLAYERPDHAPVVDLRVSYPTQSLHRDDPFFTKPHLNGLGMETQIDFQAHQP